MIAPDHDPGVRVKPPETREDPVRTPINIPVLVAERTRVARGRVRPGAGRGGEPASTTVGEMTREASDGQESGTRTEAIEDTGMVSEGTVNDAESEGTERDTVSEGTVNDAESEGTETDVMSEEMECATMVARAA